MTYPSEENTVATVHAKSVTDICFEIERVTKKRVIKEFLKQI